MRVRRRQKDREINKGKKNTYETKTSIHKRSGSRPSPEDTRLLFPSAGGAVSPTRFPADEQLKADIKVGAEERQAKKRAKTEPKLTVPWDTATRLRVCWFWVVRCDIAWYIVMSCPISCDITICDISIRRIPPIFFSIPNTSQYYYSKQGKGSCAQMKAYIESGNRTPTIDRRRWHRTLFCV